MTWNVILGGEDMTVFFSVSSWVGTQEESLARSFSLVCIGSAMQKVSSELFWSLFCRTYFLSSLYKCVCIYKKWRASAATSCPLPAIYFGEGSTSSS